MSKVMALELNKGLILLPQTYGPFASIGTRRVAKRIVRGAKMAWARDEHSFAILRDLAGDDFDPEKHRCGVDVAFALKPRHPGDRLPSSLALSFEQNGTPIVGINISGLIYNDPGAADSRYGLRADYREVIHHLLSRIIRDSHARILLIPHVLTPVGHYESDCHACAVAFDRLGTASVGRVAVVPPIFDQSETKWLIGQMDWFCGTRMHSTIAALSSGTPTAAISYSDKTAGVFDTCGMNDYVADPRKLDTEGMVDHLWQSWLRRGEAKQTLQFHLPKVLRTAEEQMDAIVAKCIELRDAPRQFARVQ